MRARGHLVRFFLLWSLAFYALALGYAFDGRRQVLPAVLSILVVVSALSGCARTAFAPNRAR